MNYRDMAILIIKANGGKIRGRTTIQNLVYLSCKSIKELKPPSFTSHYYGPYNLDVGEAFRDLVAYDFVKETIRQEGNYFTYEYELTDDGIEIIDNGILKKHKNEYNKIEKIVKICKEYCDEKIDINELSYAAKIYHAAEDDDGVTLDMIIEKAKDYNWKINPNMAPRGVELLRLLDLAK